ncbi:MgtC/SapB family protein [Embleya hyalina]|uniref:MgtC/SapB family protein n=1 Tax=Embleya hyalina TaxID=516124 RepID=UPI000F82B8FD|nr:MgtC/SapB family protein [Embleya hyalina]
MHTITTTEFLVRLAVGVCCGALIGIERQWRARMAGLRTNALVATGATLFVLHGEAITDTGNNTQIAAYVVSGIGFLGGGVILRDGAGVRGLNTAATLWCSAAVGVLAASGRPALAFIGTAAVLAVHLLLRPAGRLIDHAPQGEGDITTPATVHLVCDRPSEARTRALLVQALDTPDILILGLSVRRDDADTARLEAVLVVTGPVGTVLEQLVARLSLTPDVRDLHWHVTEDHSNTDERATSS